MNILAYTTIGFNKDYLVCLDLLIQSLALCMNQENNKALQVKFAVMIDKQLENDWNPPTANLAANLKIVKYLVETHSQENHDASMNKLKIFSLMDKHNDKESLYDAVFFLDADMLVSPDFDLAGIMKAFVAHPKKETHLFAYQECNDQNDHKNMFWTLPGAYSPTDMKFFADNGILPFNAGCFLFAPNKALREHFQNILDMIDKHRGPFFYEQSFMNVYFNKRNLTCIDLLTKSNYRMFPEDETEYKGTIVHFCGSPGHGGLKSSRMRRYFQKYFRQVAKSTRPTIL